MVDSTIRITKSYLQEIPKGNDHSEFETFVLQGLELIHVGKGILRCKLLVTDRVAVGAMTTVMDAIDTGSPRPALTLGNMSICLGFKFLLRQDLYSAGDGHIPLLISTLHFIQRPRFKFPITHHRWAPTSHMDGQTALHMSAPGTLQPAYKFCSGQNPIPETIFTAEKVEIEARVNGTNAALKSAVIEITRQGSGEILATGRLWMAPLSVKAKHNAFSLSKL